MPIEEPIFAGQGRDGGCPGAQVMGQSGKRDSRDWNEQQAEPDALHDTRDDDCRLRHIERKAGHVVKRATGKQQPGQDQVPRVHRLHKAGYHHHCKEGTNPARTEQEARSLDRVSEQILHEGCDERHGAEQHDADNDHENASAQEVAILEHLELHERLVCGQRMRKEIIKADYRHDRLDPYFTGIKPAHLLAAIEQQLQ